MEEVTRTHQAELYEMKTELRPERTMTAKTFCSEPGGKLTAMLAEDQFSRKTEQTRRTGMERRLL